MSRMSQPTRNQLIFIECEKRKTNCSHVARKYGLSRQRVHQIILVEAKKLGRKPKFYKEPGEITEGSKYRETYHD
jgi:Mor family transcriptional regulator